jgi:hypothetical protein
MPSFSTINDIDRAARRAAARFSTAVSYLDELAAELRDDAKRAESLRRPSTSLVPWRCPAPSCAEWNAAVRRICRHCGAPL